MPEGTKVARACTECWSVIVDPIGNGREKCRMCGHEQDEPGAPPRVRIIPSEEQYPIVVKSDRSNFKGLPYDLGRPNPLYE